MKIKVIGKYGRYAPFNAATNCYLIQSESGKNIVLDLGSGGLSGLQKYIDIKDIDMVIITHLHFDHASDLGVLAYSLGYLGLNKLKVYITAENIKDSTVMIEPLNGETTIVGESIPLDKVLWITFVLALFAVIFKISKDISEEDDKILIKKDIKDREIQLYRKYRSEMAINPGIDSHTDIRMRKMLKKIDRKIDERLTSVIK